MLKISVQGVPNTTYTLKIRYSNTDTNVAPEDEPLPDTFDELEITTDEDGEAEGELYIPDPEPRHTRCYVGVESTSYQFRFPSPTMGVGKCFRIDWAERVYDPAIGRSIANTPVAGVEKATRYRPW